MQNYVNSGKILSNEDFLEWLIQRRDLEVKKNSPEKLINHLNDLIEYQKISFKIASTPIDDSSFDDLIKEENAYFEKIANFRL